MHDGERIKSRSDVIEHNPASLGQPLQSPNGKRLPNIEGTEEYKAGEKSFPSEWYGDECNQLTRYFIDDHELWVF